MDLELATTEQLIAEMERRPNFPFILIVNDAPRGFTGCHWNPQSFPTVFHVLHEINVANEQFYRFLYHEFQQMGGHN